MSVLCNLTCVSPVNPPTRYDDPCARVTRKYGFEHFILLRCDYDIGDISVPANWASGGSVHLSPRGKLTFNAPSVNTLDDAYGCREELITSSEYDLDFQTIEVAADVSDGTYWRTLLKNYTQFRLALIDCNELLWIHPDFAGGGASAGNSPGFEFSVTEPPYPIEVGVGLFAWKTKFKVTIVGQDMMIPVSVPGAYSALAA